MNFLSVSYNIFPNVYGQYNTKNIVQKRSANNTILQPLKADTVSFTSLGNAKNAEHLRALLKFGIPDFYSGNILIDPNEMNEVMDKRIFSKKIKTVVRYLNKHKDSLGPVEKHIFGILKSEAKKNPKARLDEIIHKLVPSSSKKLLALQNPIFTELDNMATDMPPDLYAQYNYLMHITRMKISNRPVYIPFSVKEFKYKLGRIQERIDTSKNSEEKMAMEKLLKIASSVPEITREKRLSKDFPMKSYEAKQIRMVLKASDYLDRSALKDNNDLQALIDSSKSRVFKVATNIKFNRKTFIYDLKKLLDKLEDRELAREMEKVAVTLPTSKEYVSAFIMKSADRSSEQIGYDLLSGSIGTVDHLLPRKKKNISNISNYVLSSARTNSDKAHSRLSVYIRKNPDIRLYAQRHVNRLIELANDGTFKEVGLPVSYITTLKNHVYEMTKDETNPLILDISALKYK